MCSGLRDHDSVAAFVCVSLSFPSLSSFTRLFPDCDTRLFCQPKDKAQFSIFPLLFSGFFLSIVSFFSLLREKLENIVSTCLRFLSPLEPHLIRCPPPSLSSVSSMTFMLRRPSHHLTWPLGSHLTQLILETYLLTWLLTQGVLRVCSWNFHLFLLASSQPLLGLSSFLWS